jgi:tripartite ATP-independent transporter DctP family solute receptor
MLDFPFIVSTTKQADALLDGPFGTALQAKLPEKGLVGLGMWEVGFRHVTNSKRPVSRLEDMEGLKIRVQPTPVFVETFKALKTNPVPLAFSELYAALETKAVDAQENPYQNIRSTKLYEVQKHVTNTSHVYGMVYVVASKMFWDKLSPTERKILQDAAIEARDFQRQTSRAQAEQAIAALKASGMVFTEMSDAERDRMRQATKSVTDKVLTEYDPTLVKLFQSELDRVHKLR